LQQYRGFNMPNIVPTPGRIVLYTLSADDVARITTYQAHSQALNYVQPVKAGDVYPALVVSVDGANPDGDVLLHVFHEGHVRAYVSDGSEPGKFHWMEYQKGQAAKYEELERAKLQSEPDAAEPPKKSKW
jgi:hypothetical protein